MKILITGAAGFLGSHLCEKLKSLGHEVSGQIINGKYIRGQIDKRVMGGGSKCLIQSIFNDFIFTNFSFSPPRITASTRLLGVFIIVEFLYLNCKYFYFKEI